MPSTHIKGFALLDCNNFYVSCERVFRPKLNKLPAIVLSNNDGCIIARSREVKELGIAMGAPHFKYQHLIKKYNIQLFSPNFPLYADMSDRVMQILYDFSDQIQIYSIDEAFIPIHFETEKDFIALQQKVTKWTGIPVTIGLGPTKTLAKLANYRAKKLNIPFFSLMDPLIHDAVLKETDIHSIWQIGAKTSEKLQKLRIYNAYELKSTPLDFIQKKINLQGMRTAIELSGTPCFYPEIHVDPQKSLAYSSSFGTSITCFERLKETVIHYTSNAAFKLRSKKRLTRMMSLYLKTNDSSFQKSLSFNFSTNSTPLLIEGALTLLNQIYQKQIYKKAGIYLWELSSETENQFDFRSSENPAHTKLMKTLDQVNNKYGKGTLFYASEGTTKPWLSKKERLSCEYTTKLDQILKIDLNQS